MRGFVPPDPSTSVSIERFAIVYVPKRSRKRFSIGCVEVVETEEQALAGSDENSNRYAAKVLGPSKSSEGQYLYYLINWIR